MADDDPIQLLRDVLSAVESGFEENRNAITALGVRVNGLEKQVGEAHGGVKMTLAGLEGLTGTVDTLRDGVLQLSARVSQLHEGVADQVRLEVEKQNDADRPFASLPDHIERG